ncbi:MAG TPA: orotate phosphoribosyltransferase [Nitrospiria bacterium]
MGAAKLENYQKELLHLLLQKSFKYSPDPIFTLTSGKKSCYYIDCKKTTLDSQGTFLIGQILFHRVKDLPAKGIGGLTLGADPIAVSVALTSAIYNQPISAFIIRKEPKKHGTQRWIEGNVPVGSNVVVVEDVVTTGGSTRKAIEVLEKEGYKILRVLALVDRQEGGRENIDQMGHHLESLYTLKDLMQVYNQG